jgi:hypothetical protein
VLTLAPRELHLRRRSLLRLVCADLAGGRSFVTLDAVTAKDVRRFTLKPVALIG